MLSAFLTGGIFFEKSDSSGRVFEYIIVSYTNCYEKRFDFNTCIELALKGVE